MISKFAKLLTLINSFVNRHFSLAEKACASQLFLISQGNYFVKIHQSILFRQIGWFQFNRWFSTRTLLLPEKSKSEI